MRSLIVLILLLVAVAPKAAERAPTAIVSKDSLVFEFSAPDVGARWEWNNLPKGAIEHQWVFDFPVQQSANEPFPVDAPETVHFGLVQKSTGSPAVGGRLSELMDISTLHFWVTTPDGEGKGQGFDTGVKPALENGTVKVTLRRLFMVEYVVRLRPTKMALRGVRADGAVYEEAVVVTNFRDPREAQARGVTGPFSPDEYAVYQTVIARAFHQRMVHEPDLKWSLFTPSVDASVFSSADGNVEVLGAADDTMADYLKKRSMRSDLASLSALGYDVVDSDKFEAERKKSTAPGARGCHVRVSRIGFNAAGDQALVYCEHSCGGLSGEGEAILLDRVDGEWRVTRRINLWIS